MIYKTICQTILDCLDDQQQPCPDSLSELVVERLDDFDLDDQQLGQIYELVYSLSSVLVKDVGQYL